MSTPSVHRTSTKSHLADDWLVAELRSALAGQFTIERLLGRGGMGVVYLARELRLDRPVALKVLPPDLANEPAVRERFLREARTAALLSHPNIIPIYRVDEIGDLVFIVMGFVAGPTLGARIRSAGAIPAPEAAKILREVAWALAYAHAHGVVHCDVKPDNILLDEATGRALVTDFGIAQDVRGRSAGAPTPILGSAHFMSPEQVTGEPLDAPSDIYSLGVVGWYAVTGQLPFDGKVSDVLRKQVHEPPPPLAEVAPEVSPALAQTLERALAKSPDDRFPSAEAFADAIDLSVAPPLVSSVPVQVWLAGGDDLRYVLAAAIGATGLAMSHRGPWTEMATYAVAVLLALVLLELSDVRRLIAAGYDLGALRSALRAELNEVNSAGARRRSSSHATLRASHESMLRGAGLIVIGLALAAMGAVALINGTFSEHALGVVIAGAGLLALSRGHAVGHDWVTTARARLWCSRMGVWLARIAAWRMPAPRRSALDVALQFMSARSPMTAEVTRRPPNPEGMSERWDALQSIISELGEMVSALGDQMQESTTPLDRERAPVKNAAELDRIRQRLATLQAEVSATAVERERFRT